MKDEKTLCVGINLQEVGYDNYAKNYIEFTPIIQLLRFLVTLGKIGKMENFEPPESFV